MKESERIDFVVVFGLQRELSAFLRHVGEYSTERADITFHRANLEVGKDSSYRLILLALPEMGNYSAASATTRAIDVWNPSFVLLGGIAGGVKQDDVQLGDIIVADVIIGYEQGKQHDDRLKRRFKALRPAETLLAAAQKLAPRDWALNTAIPRPDGLSERVIPRVHFGSVLSGEKVIASSKWMKALTSDAQAALRNEAGCIAGVEMEAFGTALATYYAPTAPGMLMAKSICDWADSSKSDDWQEYAADVSATFLIGLLKSHPIPAQMPRQQAERRGTKSYTSRSKIGLCSRMDDNWEDIADWYDVPLPDRGRFRAGRECQDLWKWLEIRGKLGSLPDAFESIGRPDLIEELIPTNPDARE